MEQKFDSGDWIKWFSEIDLDSKNIVGDKASKLAFLSKNNLPVLEGFVLTCETIEKLFEIWDIKEKILSLLGDLKNRDIEFDKFKEDIKRIILNEDFPEEVLQEIFEAYEVLSSNKYEIEVGSALEILKSSSEYCFVSVRSSPNIKINSENSFLNIKGRQDLIKSIKYSIISNYFDYDSLERNDFEFFSSGVIIQKMIQSEKSGIVSSKDSEGNLVIEAIWGYGLGLDLEGINRDKYILSPSLSILDIKINEKNLAFIRDSSGKEKVVKLRPERSSHQVLNNYEIQRIGDLSLKSEYVFKKPIKIQFAIEGEDFFITNLFDLDLVIKEEEVVIEKKLEINPLDVFTKSKIELIVQDVLEKDLLEKTKINEAGMVVLDEIIASSKKHRDYYWNYNMYKEYRILIEEGLKNFVGVFDEVFVSINNFLSDDFGKLEGSSFIKEPNSYLGNHGIRYGLKYQEMLEAEIFAIKNSLEDVKGGILVPFVTDIKEFREFKELLKARNFDKKVGIIVDNPASIQLISEFSKLGLDLVVIDFDKIVESVLMVDLKHESFPRFFDFNNLALLNQLEYFIRVCKRNNIEIKVKISSLLEDAYSFFIKKEVDSFLIDINSIKEVSSLVKELESKLISGTDREPRDYEINKEKRERNLERVEDREIVKVDLVEKGIEEDLPENIKLTEENLDEGNELKKEKLAEDSEEDLPSDIETIQKESEEVVSEYNLEDLLDSNKKLDPEKGHKELKEDGEEFDSGIEDFSKEDKVDEEGDKKKVLEDESEDDYDKKEESLEKERDSLGIF